MLLKKTLTTGIIAAALTFTVNAAPEKGVNVGPATDSSPSSIEQLALASELIEFGVENKDPLALLVAARLQAAVPTTEKAQSKQETGTGVSEESAKKSSSEETSPLELARDLATEQQLQPVLALIDAQQDVRSRGLLRGPTVHTDRVRARQNDIYTLTFEGGERAAVLIEGDGDTDLDLYVYDEFGNQVCRDADSTDTMVCIWYPKWTGDFEIKVKNLGSVYNEYTMFFE